jgi:CDP-glycerol glycerophosphotransferase (TagB/SpsB family)
MLPLGKKFNYVFCADEIAKDRFQSAYNYPVMILPFGYPRWAGLYSKDIDICRLISQYDKVISYLPTLRFNNHQQLDPFSFQGFSDFCKFLENKNYLLIVRPHPSMVFENEHSVSSNVALRI